MKLSHLEPVAVGSQRYVFVHPQNPDLLVKVPTEKYRAHNTGTVGPWHKRFFRSRRRMKHFQVFLREIREHLALRAESPLQSPHVQNLIGFAETDMGNGLVTEAVRDRSGDLAPTLRHLLRSGRFDAVAERQLEIFFAWLLESPLIVGDLTVGNLVYGYRPDIGEHFVLIDGLGEKNLIPFNSLSRRLNRRTKLRKIGRVRARIERERAALAARESADAVSAVYETAPPNAATR